MTCFWQGLLHGVTNHQIESNFKLNLGSIYDLIQLFKRHNQPVTDVKWNSQSISHQQLEENYRFIQDYDSSQISNGHLCSICDGFLLLTCQLFKVNIVHKYLGRNMNYTHPNASYTIRFESDQGHFWFVSVTLNDLVIDQISNSNTDSILEPTIVRARNRNHCKRNITKPKHPKINRFYQCHYHNK